SGALLFAPSPVIAEDPILGGTLVPTCAETNNEFVGFAGACQLCDLVKLTDNLIRFAVAFSVIVATLMFAYAGFLYFTAAASEANIKKAHGIFSKVFAGLIIILVAWLVVDIFMRTLVNQGEIGVWHEIQCVPYPVGENLAAWDESAVGNRIVPYTPDEASVGGQCASGGAPQRSQNDIAEPCLNCIPLNLTTTSADCFKGRPPGEKCLVNPTLSERMQALNTALARLAQSIVVTGAVGGIHCATCQIAGSPNVGTCIDARAERTDPRSVRAFIDAANNARLRAQLEFTSAEELSAFKARATADGINFIYEDPNSRRREVIFVEHASGVHYSIYYDQQ
ncbi:pilin, partial [Patescibacteria group bacterium]|nr:pilin [Patescibacteria group bacterium]